MTWGNPSWLWGLLALPGFLVLLRLQEKQQAERLERFAKRSLWGTIFPELDLARARLRALVWSAAFALLVVSLARPQWGEREETMKLTGLDVVIVLDVSNSMEVEDLSPSRLRLAQHFIRSLTDRLAGDRVGLVAFAASAWAASPLTTDTSYVHEVASELTPRAVINQGTDVATALETAHALITRASENGASGEPSVDAGAPASKVIILISDGEDHEKGSEAVVDKLREGGVLLLALGVGTEAGGPIPVRDDLGGLRGFKRDSRGGTLVSTFRPAFLKGLAERAGGRYWTLSPLESELEEILSEVGRLHRTDNVERKLTIREERFYLPLLLGVLLLVVELLLPRTRPRSRPSQSSEARLRKSGNLRKAAASAPLVFLFLLWIPSAAQAVGVGSYLRNERARSSLSEGKPEEAQDALSDAQVEEPDRPELMFNQGVLQLQRKDAPGATQAFEETRRISRQTGDTERESFASYNLAHAHEASGQVEKAAGAYLDAIRQAQSRGDAELERMARENLSLLLNRNQGQNSQNKNSSQQDQQQDKQQQQDQQQQQQQNQQQDKQQQPDKKDSQGQPDQKDQNDPQEQKDSQQKQDQKIPETGRERKKRDFQSSKLSEQEAKQVLDELSAREKELRMRIRKQRGSKQTIEKDW